MVTKKIRTEYMKKFREPKWETFSKCYEDSLKYRLTRRVMEHSHKPWFWEGREYGSVLSSGQSTPRTAIRLGCNRVAPLPTAVETNQQRSSPEIGPPSDQAEEEEEAEDGDAAAPAVAQTENVQASDGADETDGADKPQDSSDANVNPAELLPLQGRQRRCRLNSCHSNRWNANAKMERAKSQPPPGGARGSRCEHERSRKATTPNNSDCCDASVQTMTAADRRRARSADPDKLRRWQRRHLTASATTDERWVTEYMRCFSARVR